VSAHLGGDDCPADCAGLVPPVLVILVSEICWVFGYISPLVAFFTPYFDASFCGCCLLGYIFLCSLVIAHCLLLVKVRSLSLFSTYVNALINVIFII
jgi:hypothetical protein